MSSEWYCIEVTNFFQFVITVSTYKMQAMYVCSKYACKCMYVCHNLESSMYVSVDRISAWQDLSWSESWIRWSSFSPGKFGRTSLSSLTTSRHRRFAHFAIYINLFRTSLIRIHSYKQTYIHTYIHHSYVSKSAYIKTHIYT